MVQISPVAANQTMHDDNNLILHLNVLFALLFFVVFVYLRGFMTSRHNEFVNFFSR